MYDFWLSLWVETNSWFDRGSFLGSILWFLWAWWIAMYIWLIQKWFYEPLLELRMKFIDSYVIVRFYSNKIFWHNNYKSIIDSQTKDPIKRKNLNSILKDLEPASKRIREAWIQLSSYAYFIDWDMKPRLIPQSVHNLIVGRMPNKDELEKVWGNMIWISNYILSPDEDWKKIVRDIQEIKKIFEKTS